MGHSIFGWVKKQGSFMAVSPKLILLMTIMVLALRCGSAGVGETSPCLICGEKTNVFGAITNQFGNQATMVGWVIVLVERDTGICRLAEVDSAGLFQFTRASATSPFTVIVLSPDYLVMAVLSMPSPVPASIRQFFTLKKSSLPRLIYKGPIASFEDEVSIRMTNDLAADINSDGIPDGSVSLGYKEILGLTSFKNKGSDFHLTPRELASLTGAAGQIDGNAGHDSLVGLSLQKVPDQDTDLDRTPNHRDPDIDGDGIINLFDPDDDGDAILDVFDLDANGDLINDQTQSISDLHFPAGVHFVNAQFELKPKDNGSGNQTTLKLTAKVRDDVTPQTVQMKGAPSLLQGANVLTFDADGNPIETGWTMLLDDDGLSEDSQAQDRIFGKKIVLQDAKIPRAHETVFFRLGFVSDGVQWFMDYPYVFPDLKPSSITGQYDPATKTVLLVGNPFGTLQDYVWSINLFDATTGSLLWTSPQVPGVTGTYTIQENVIDTTKTYKFSVVAQVLDRIPGFPRYTIHSAKADLK